MKIYTNNEDNLTLNYWYVAVMLAVFLVISSALIFKFGAFVVFASLFSFYVLSKAKDEFDDVRAINYFIRKMHESNKPG